MEKHFAHLHLHTEFSLLDGAIRIPDLVNLAKEQRWKSLAISDHGNIFGAVKFFQYAKKAGIKPVLATEFYFTPDSNVRNAKEKYYHLMLFAQNKEGYKNLCQLMAFSYQTGFYFKPRVDFEILEKHSAGLIASSACPAGYIPTLLRDGKIDEAKKTVDWFLNVFGPDRFWFEVQPPELEISRLTNDVIFKYGKEWNIPCIATCDSHYLNKEDKDAHEVLLSIQTKDQLSNPDRFSFGDFVGYVRTTQEMLDVFKDNEDVVWNTGKLTDSCEFDFETGKLLFPSFPIPEQYTKESFFAKLCHDGMNKIKEQALIPKDAYEQYDERLKIEIDLITKMGFIGYFLVVSDFIQWGKRQGIPIGPGRGSAAGSLVAWAMEITNVDPIKYNLLFERFLNPERISMPDIDIDFCIERREEVIEYVKNKYGHDCVCQIITFGTMMAKGVVKDVARTMGFPFQDSNAITDLIPDTLKITLKEAVEQEPRLKSLIDSNPQVQKLMDICFKLEGLTRHASKHAAGIVISPSPLSSCLPLYIPAKTDELVAQFSMTDLELIGFLKMDFLGLKNLTVIDRVLKAIKRNHDVDINLDKLPFDDKKTFELVANGQTDGVFQFESEGIKEVLRKLQPDKFEDLIAVNALYRPGPLGSGMVDDYIDRRHGRKPTIYQFPQLEPILSETYGVIVYQEQVMKIASVIGGYSLGGADLLRRAMGKKKADVMAAQKSQFVAGAEKLGFDPQKAKEIFELMEYFAGYGFNKSHSTAYAIIAYHTAYLKAHYPNEFMASLVSFETSSPDQFQKYLQEIRDMKIKIIPPDINRSDVDFTAQHDGIVFGLQGIKNVGSTALLAIIEERKKGDFKDMLDFCKRVDLRVANKRVIENLTYAGATDSLPGSRAQKIAELDKIIDLAQQAKEAAKTGQMGLFDLGAEAKQKPMEQYYAFQPMPEWPVKEILEKEKEVAGFYLSAHPLESYPSARWVNATSFADALKLVKNVTSIKEPFVTCLGLMQNYRSITTKKGDPMAFAQFEDMTGDCEVIIFPTTYKKVEALLGAYNVFIIKGAMDITSQNKCKIKANNLIPVELFADHQDLFQNMILEAPGVVDDDKFNQLKLLLKKGKVPLQLSFKENNRMLFVDTNQRIDCVPGSLAEIEKLGFKIKLIA
jgi:DNA polymerase-3 subunit alpha